MKILIAVLFSAALIWLHGGTSPAHINNSVTAKPAKAKTVQAVAPEKATVVQSTAPTEPTTVIEPEVKPQVCKVYRDLIAQYDWNVNIMTAVMQAESSCNPNAVNRHNYDGIYDYGLLQLHGQAIYEPHQNIAAAYRLWKVQGYRAWSAYKSGAYLIYI